VSIDESDCFRNENTDSIRYFSLYALQHFYLPSPVHSRFINKAVLHRYMGVGGVRIEDDILITSKGYENLTTAPKGDAMFEFIRGYGSTTNPAQRSSGLPPKEETGPRLFRAPGCPPRTMPSRPRQPRRAATAPNDTTQEHRISNDRCNHALNFKRSMTTDERVQHWRQSRQQHSPERSPNSQGHQQTICGATTPSVKHVVMGGDPSHTSQTSGLADCADCAILAQTLCRLRQNLAASRQGSPSNVKQLRDALPIADRTLPLSRTAGTTVHNGPEAVSNARICPLNTTRQHHNNGNSNNDRRLSAAPDQTHPPATNILSSAYVAPQSLYSSPLQFRNKVSFNDVVRAPNGKDPEAYYRGHEHCEPALPRNEILGRQDLLENDLHYGGFQGYPTSRTKLSMPLSTHISKTQEQRRLSNQTDDRDWMA
jgi:Xaa-Pro dipeptidase